MKRFISAALILASPAGAQDAAPATPASIVSAAPANEWKAIDPADLLVMTLAPDTAGQPRTVVIQLMPPPFSQGWVGNIRTLAKTHWWDGTSVYRVVDNWVTQWGDGEDDEAKAKPLPASVASPTKPYDSTNEEITREEVSGMVPGQLQRAIGQGSASDLRLRRAEIQAIVKGDPYVRRTMFWRGWPIGLGGGELQSPTWPLHCYGSVGVARDLESTGTGAELYAVVGQAPRQLDRNIAVVGRVIEGIEHLSALPRGKGEAGVYDDVRLRVPILSVRLGTDLQEPPRFEYLNTDSDSFARYLQVSANRSDPFYKVPAGGIDICNAKVPIRRVGAK